VYRAIFTRFVAAGLRSLSRGQERCRLPLTDDLKQAARELLDHLQAYAQAPSAPPVPSEGHSDGDKHPSEVKRSKIVVPPPLLHSLHTFFFLCVTSVIKGTQDSKFKCPVQVFLACFGYNEDDTFKMPSELTSHLAGWQYLLRCAALYEAVSLEESGRVDSVFR
jgi:hypothetical protein